MAGQILGLVGENNDERPNDKKVAVQINWTGFVTFSSPLTMLIYLPFVSTNQSSPMKNITGKSLDCSSSVNFAGA